MDLLARRHWVFDMDGTLTVAAHDFDAIRAELGLPDGPILESLDRLPADEAAHLHARLEDIEEGIARRTEAQPGAAALLADLRDRGATLGIVTRNKQRLAHITLAAAGLAEFFTPADVLGRDEAPHKPSPAGIQLLLRRWGAEGADAVMVGDYLFDLQAGRAAGTATVLFDVRGLFAWADHADRCVRDLRQLLDP